MIIRKYELGPVRTNCFLLEDEKTNEAVLIDPGEKSSEIEKYIIEEKLVIKYIINTHGHFDHIGGNAFFFKKGMELAVHPLSIDLIKSKGGSSLFGFEIDPSPEPTLKLEDGDKILFGNQTLEILHTPGHTPGCISIYNKNAGVVFCGDALFFRSIGRTDFPGGNHAQLLKSIRQKLYMLPEDTKVYTGHGPETTIGDEKNNNPWTI